MTAKWSSPAARISPIAANGRLDHPALQISKISVFAFQSGIETCIVSVRHDAGSRAAIERNELFGKSAEIGLWDSGKYIRSNGFCVPGNPWDKRGTRLGQE